LGSLDPGLQQHDSCDAREREHAGERERLERARKRKSERTRQKSEEESAAPEKGRVKSD